MLGTIKLLSSTNNKITKVENGGDLPNLEITEVVLVYSNVVNNDYQHDLIDLYTFVLIIWSIVRYFI